MTDLSQLISQNDEEALKIHVVELEAKLAAIGRSQCVIEFDMDGKVLSANQNFLRTFDYEEAEVIGRNHAMFVEADDLDSEAYAHFWMRLREGHFFSDEYKRIGRSGKSVWIHATYNPIFGPAGLPYKVVKYACDVTVRKLQSANSSGQIAAIDKAQAIVEFDLNGHVIGANPNYLAITGYQLEEIQGRHHRMFVDDEEVKLCSYEAFWSSLRQGKHHSGEYRRLTRDGQVVWLQASYNPILDLEGRPFKIVKYATDLTQTVLQRLASVSLEAARASAEASTAAKGQFLANMSHELRTPLSSILGFATLIGAGDGLSDQDRRYLGLIRSAGQTLLSVVNDILDFSKLEAGALVLNPAPFSMRELVEEVSALMAETAAGKGLMLNTDIADDVSLCADHDRLKQVLLNLLGNAIKFTAEGAVTVQARTERAGRADQVTLEVQVTDTGCGISVEATERLFERFMQQDASITRRFGGTGLGLAISRQIIEVMGGEIGVASDGVSGSTFWFRVPCDVTSLETDRQRRLAVAHPSGPLPHFRVLLAEDHPSNRALVTALLAPFDLQLDYAENGQEALEAVFANPYHLVLMDMQMPVMDGITATRAIRASSGQGASVPIIALTANILPAQIQECLSAGMQGHLTKPINVGALYDVLNLYGSAAQLGDASACPRLATG